MILRVVATLPAQGSIGAEQMFAMALAENTQLTWILRGAGAILMLITEPISLLADVETYLALI